MENYFTELSNINVNDKIEKKNGLSYLAWAFAWGELKKRHPDADYTVYENNDQWNYFTDGKTCWVKTGVTVNGLEHIEYLPVMDFKNRSIPADAVTSFDVNKAIQRSLTKAVARHGLGLYIYAGEDLPEDGEKFKPNVYDTPGNERGKILIEISKLCKNEGLVEEACRRKFGKSLGELDNDELAAVKMMIEDKQKAKANA